MLQKSSGALVEIYVCLPKLNFNVGSFLVVGQNYLLLLKYYTQKEDTYDLALYWEVEYRHEKYYIPLHIFSFHVTLDYPSSAPNAFGSYFKAAKFKASSFSSTLLKCPLLYTSALALRPEPQKSSKTMFHHPFLPDNRTSASSSNCVGPWLTILRCQTAEEACERGMLERTIILRHPHLTAARVQKLSPAVFSFWHYGSHLS